MSVAVLGIGAALRVLSPSEITLIHLKSHQAIAAAVPHSAHMNFNNLIADSISGTLNKNLLN